MGEKNQYLLLVLLFLLYFSYISPTFGQYLCTVKKIHKTLMEFAKKEEAFEGSDTHTICEDGCTLLILRIKGNYLPQEEEIIERIGNCNNNDMRFNSADSGSIIIRLEMFSSAFQSFEYFLSVIDKLLQDIFPTTPLPKVYFDVLISISVELVQQFEGMSDFGNKAFPMISKQLPDVVDKTKLSWKEITESVQGMSDFWKKEFNMISNQLQYVGNKTKLSWKESTEAVQDKSSESTWLFEVRNLIGANNEYKNSCQRVGTTTEIITMFTSRDSCTFYAVGGAYEGTVTPDKSSESTWLFEVLNLIGANNEYKNSCQRVGTTSEIITMFTSRDSCTFYAVGGAYEGTVTPGAEIDHDIIIGDERFPVIDNISQAQNIKHTFLIVKENNTSAGYVKLQWVYKGTPCTKNKHGNLFNNWLKNLVKDDKYGRMCLCDIIYSDRDKIPFLSKHKNKPAVLSANHYDLNLDAVFCYRCNQWPTEAETWLSRKRCNGWPTKNTIVELKSLGYFLVKKGHPHSPEADFEWRISLSLQERKLVRSLTDVQHKCYIVLKMINREIIKLECITTYHWKTCLFYVIEECEENVWDQNMLFHCIEMCIKRMNIWVKKGFCPNYFIETENQFDGIFTVASRLELEEKLAKLSNFGMKNLILIKSNKISEYVLSRGSAKLLKILQEDSMKSCKEALYKKNAQPMAFAMYVFSRYIANNSNVIELLWRMQYDIQHIHTISEHTPEETRSSLLLFKPLICTSLASNISAMSIQQSNPQVRDFLLLGCYTLFINGDLSGRLKFISVLYAAGCYMDCEWNLEQLDEEYIKNNPSICNCHMHPSSITPMTENIDFCNLKMSTCLLFLPSEIQIIPDAMKYEMFKDFGISLDKRDKVELNRPWHYGAVVDSNIYYFFLKFLIKKKLKGSNFTEDDYHDIKQINDLLSGSNVRHPTVAYNLMAWILSTFGLTPKALDNLRMSWKDMLSLDLCFLIKNKEMKKKKYLFNSAKIHALVILYNTWKPWKLQFCFRCCEFRKDPKRCSKCKIATYCSKQCQRKNWKHHKAFCELVDKERLKYFL